MARLDQLLLLVLLAYSDVIAAPRDLKLEDITKVAAVNLESNKPVTLEELTLNEEITRGDRQKRFYNYYGYGFPTMNPVSYPNHPNLNTPYPGNFAEDPYLQIYRRLQDISNAVRYPNFNSNQPPLLPAFPVLLPVLFIPQVGCNCGSQPTPPRQNGTDSNVGISNRFPEMDDERQNWGLVVNQNETEEDDGMPEDFTRPISFEPIKPNKTATRPPPAVEHGSNQLGNTMAVSTTTTQSPRVTPPVTPPPSVPSPCDAAILICCHQPEVTYECFVTQGCPDLTNYGNPCDGQVILQVIDRYQRFYGQRNE